MLLSLLLWAAQSPRAAELAQQVLRGPYLQRLGQDRVLVSWRTSYLSDARVSWGPQPSVLTSTLMDPAVSHEHAIEITGLGEDEVLYYAVGTSGELLAGADSDHWFRTSPAENNPAPLRVWMVGDCGTGGAQQAAVRDAYLAWSATHPAQHLFLLGDNAYAQGLDSEYQRGVFDPYADLLLNTPLWSTRGNHDADAATYAAIFSPPVAGEIGGLASGSEAFYSFEIGDAHFICLDSFASDRLAGGAMMTWLAADLVAHDRLWTIAFWHHPPYTKGSHDSDDPMDSGGRMRDMREIALPILEAGGADLVVNGHSHSYERSTLLDGHYGLSSTFGPQYQVDPGDGREFGDGPYFKIKGPNSGTVYVVAGSAGKLTAAPLDHPAMPHTSLSLGSFVLDISGWRLDGSFLDVHAVVRDQFTIYKQ
jgi:hypothetical protein